MTDPSVPPPTSVPSSPTSAPSSGAATTSHASAWRGWLPIALWWLAFVNLFVAALLWLRPGATMDGTPGSMTGATTGATTDPEQGHGPAPVDGTTPPDGPSFDMQTFVAAPPVPGRPSAAALDDAIRRGTEAFLNLYVEPSLRYAEGGGFLDYVMPDGSTKRLGPDVYVQCHLYLIVHAVMYQQELGLPRDHPIVQRALRFLLSTFDDARGRWLWSEEGCLHSKGLIALARFGEKERFEKGWRWALTSPLHLEREGLFTMMQSGRIIQTLGPATRSLSGEDAWDHGAPIPDEENGAKFVYALLESGRDVEDPELAGLARRQSDFLARNPMAIGHMNTRHLVGRAWLVYEYAHWRFPPDDGYRLALGQLRAAGRGEWRHNFMMRVLPAFRSEVLRALLETGERNAELDAMVNGFVAAQASDGAWRVPELASLWSFDRPPKEGYKFGNMDGANTYMITLGLISWRDHVLKDDAR